MLPRIRGANLNPTAALIALITPDPIRPDQIPPDPIPSHLTFRICLGIYSRAQGGGWNTPGLEHETMALLATVLLSIWHYSLYMALSTYSTALCLALLSIYGTLYI